MPLRVDKLGGLHIHKDIAKEHHAMQRAAHRHLLAEARHRKELEKLISLVESSHALFHAADMKLAELWETLREQHKEGVDLNVAFRYLWSSFEGDMRFLCDHLMEDDPHDKMAMAHAAGNALVGVRAVVMMCLRNEDPPFSVDDMLDYIKNLTGGYSPRDNRFILSSDQAWGDGVSKNG